MPKIIHNKYLIQKTFLERNKYGLNARSIASIFCVSYKTIYNYAKISPQNLTIKITRKD